MTKNTTFLLLTLQREIIYFFLKAFQKLLHLMYQPAGIHFAVIYSCNIVAPKILFYLFLESGVLFHTEHLSLIHI